MIMKYYFILLLFYLCISVCKSNKDANSLSKAEEEEEDILKEEFDRIRQLRQNVKLPDLFSSVLLLDEVEKEPTENTEDERLDEKQKKVLHRVMTEVHDHNDVRVEEKQGSSPVEKKDKDDITTNPALKLKSQEKKERQVEEKETKYSTENLEHVIEIVDAPDLSQGKRILDQQGTDEDEAFKVFYKQQKKLLRRMLAQVRGYEDGVEDDLTMDEPVKEETPPPPPVELTPEEKEAQELYETGMKLLAKTKPDKIEAFKVFEKASALGSIPAHVAIAWAKLLGPLDLDIAAANKTFNELAEKGVADAHMGVGFLHASGLLGNASQPRALLHYTLGAIGGSTWAKMAMGYRYWTGATVAMNCEKALDYYRKVANKVAEEVSLSGGTAVQRIRLLDEAENPGYNSGILDNNLMEYYQLLALKGDVQAQVGLGQLHYQGGRGVQQDLQRAVHYFLQAADAGNAIAMAFLGKIYLEGSDTVKQDNVTAYKYFKQAADLGNPVGQSGLGLMYLYGKGVVQDLNKAFKYFSLAAEQGWVDGQLQLGNMYFGGQGVRRDYKQANKYFGLASQSGHVLAFYNLAQMHATGTGMLRSCPSAVELYKNVAERGKWGERLMEAHMLQREGRVDQAYVIYALLSELGYEVAQSNAAFLLDKGDVPWFQGNDRYVVAIMYWSRAGTQGYSQAQVKLGDYHYYGLGTTVDYEMAATHYRLASEQQRNAQAMFNLGYMHEQGLGMQQDMHLAKRCYDLAAETSTDAKVPVALALIKLSILFTAKYLQESHWHEWILLANLDQLFGPNWDIFLGTLLVGLVGVVIYYRRPQPIQLN